MYHEVTQGIRVTVMPVYIDERSSPSENRYFWAYRVVIANEGRVSVQLISRHWLITDANGKTEQVRGRGIAGANYEYTSGCPLTTPSGFMRGAFTMVDEEGERFEVAIPAFALDLPDAKPVLN